MLVTKLLVTNNPPIRIDALKVTLTLLVQVVGRIYARDTSCPR